MQRASIRHSDAHFAKRRSFGASACPGSHVLTFPKGAYVSLATRVLILAPTHCAPLCRARRTFLYDTSLPTGSL